jgi:hypothetical protein
MSLSEQVFKLKSLLDTVENEVKAFESGKKASAARARKTLQDVKKSSHELRKSIIEKLNQMKKDKPIEIKKEEKPIEKEADGGISQIPNQKTRKPRAKKPKIVV